MGIEPQGQNLEQLTKDGTEGAARRREEKEENVTALAG